MPAIGTFWSLRHCLRTLSTSKFVCSIESTSGWTKLFPMVNLLFGDCGRHIVTTTSLLHLGSSFEIAAVSSVLLFHWSVWISKSKITEIFSLFVCFPTCFELVNNWLRDRIMSIQSWQIMNVTLPLFKKRCVTLLRLNYGLPNMCLKPSFI